MLADELDETVAAEPRSAANGISPGADVQMAGGKKRSRRKVPSIPHIVTLAESMSGDEFRVAAMTQIFGRVIEDVLWRNVKSNYPAGPHTVDVAVVLLQRYRGAANSARGFHVDDNGGIEGAEGRAKTFHQAPADAAAAADKNALISEIDSRYYKAAGVPPGTKIKKSEKGRGSLWRMIRDEVLFQHEYIANLPPEAKKLIRISVDGKILSPADYDQLFRIAKKIERMKAGQVGDYVSKINSRAVDLDTFEKSIDSYLAEMAKRDGDAGEREKVKTKLVGLEETYKLYREYRSKSASTGVIGVRGVAPGAASLLALKEKLEASLKANGFASIGEFGQFISDFETGFEEASVVIVDDLLAKYEARLYREQQRYQSLASVESLHAQLGGVRTEQQAFRKHQTSARKLDSKRDRHTYRGEPWVSAKTGEQEQHEQKATTHKAAAKLEVGKLAAANPVFAEEQLPADKQIDKDKLSSASPAELQALLLSHIAEKIADAREARGRVAGKPALIYKMDKMLPQFYLQQSIAPGSIFDSIISDKLSDDAIKNLVVGIAAAIVAIALTVVSLGTATPAIVAAGAAAGAFGISAAMAYDEFQNYIEEEDLADVGLAKDPSAVWLVVAIVGAALDMGAAARALKALGPAADAFKATSNVDEFAKALEALKKAGELDAKMVAAAEKAARAKTAFKAAKAEFGAALGSKLYSFPGPLADPDVYIALVKMAKAQIEKSSANIVGFINEVKVARLASKHGPLSPEELAKAKQAYADAKKIVREEAEAAAGTYERLLGEVGDATRLNTLITKAGDAEKLERLLRVFSATEVEAIFSVVTEPGRVVMMLDHVGADSGAKMIRQWVAKGKNAKMNEFLENLSKGASQLDEMAELGKKSVIIDSQTAIALGKDARGLPLQSGEQAMVKYVRDLPEGTELHVGNVSIGEVGADALKLKGLPLDVARDSPIYKKLMTELESLNVGGSKGAADRALVADAFFAKSDAGLVPQFATADRNVFNKLAKKANPAIDPAKLGGKKLSELYPNGFEVEVAGQKLRVIPIQN